MPEAGGAGYPPRTMISPRRNPPRRATIGVPGRLLVATALACATAVAPPPSTAAAIPPERATVLDEALDSAIVGDVDGDGVRELVQVIPWETNPTQLAVEVISVDGSGRVTRHLQAPLRRESVPDDSEVQAGPPPDDENMLPLAPGEPARLIAWRDGGRERVLVATLGAARLAVPCCLTLWSVGVDAGGATDLELLGLTSANSDGLVRADLDGDGTDELVLIEPDGSAHPGVALAHVMTYDGARFHRVRDGLPVPPGLRFANVGDTDGLPGEEVAALAAVDGDSDPTTLYRLSMPAGGTPRLEEAGVSFGGKPVGIPGPDGPRLALVSPVLGCLLLAWPAGAEAATVAQSPRRGVPLGVLGSGEDARLVLLLEDAVVDVLDGRLRSSQGLTSSVPAAAVRSRSLPPFVGALAGGMPDGSAALIFRGRLMQPPGRAVPGPLLNTSHVAALPGMTPVGVFGPGGQSIGLIGRPGVPTDRDGGPLVFTAASQRTTLTVAETAAVLSPEVDDGALEARLEGAVYGVGWPLRQIVVARDDFEVEISAPPRSRAFFETANPFVGGASQAGADGKVTLRVARSPGAGSGDQRYAARVLLVTPAGHAYAATWEVRFQRTPPPLSVAAATTWLATRVPLMGRTDPNAVVTVNGRTVTVRRDGSFATAVEAGLLPQDVDVVATDIVGNTTRTRVSVVAFVDYRTLPWIPIVAALTLLMGGLLFVRTPRARRSDRGDDASFEEIM